MAACGGEYDYSYKVVIVGDAGSVKTEIFSNFLGRSANNSPIGVEFASRIFRVEDKNIKANVWDTSGQERFRAIISAYYRGAVGAMIVYDISKHLTFVNAERWLRELRDHASEDMVIMLVGHWRGKEHTREVTTAEAKEFAARNGLLFIETITTLRYSNVKTAIRKILSEIYRIENP